METKEIMNESVTFGNDQFTHQQPVISEEQYPEWSVSSL